MMYHVGTCIVKFNAEDSAKQYHLDQAFITAIVVYISIICSMRRANEITMMWYRSCCVYPHKPYAARTTLNVSKQYSSNMNTAHSTQHLCTL